MPRHYAASHHPCLVPTEPDRWLYSGRREQERVQCFYGPNAFALFARAGVLTDFKIPVRVVRPSPDSF